MEISVLFGQSPVQTTILKSGRQSFQFSFGKHDCQSEIELVLLMVVRGPEGNIPFIVGLWQSAETGATNIDSKRSARMTENPIHCSGWLPEVTGTRFHPGWAYSIDLEVLGGFGGARLTIPDSVPES